MHLTKSRIANTIDDRRFEIAAEAMTDRHQYEYEAVHDGSSRSEEMPSQLEGRHAREYAWLEAQRRTLSIMQWIEKFPYTR